jgi:hypothetical protein
MVIDTSIIYESLEGLLCHNMIGGVGVPVSLRHNCWGYRLGVARPFSMLEAFFLTLP